MGVYPLKTIKQILFYVNMHIDYRGSMGEGSMGDGLFASGSMGDGSMGDGLFASLFRS